LVLAITPGRSSRARSILTAQEEQWSPERWRVSVVKSLSASPSLPLTREIAFGFLRKLNILILYLLIDGSKPAKNVLGSLRVRGHPCAHLLASLLHPG